MYDNHMILCQFSFFPFCDFLAFEWLSFGYCLIIIWQMNVVPPFMSVKIVIGI